MIATSGRLLSMPTTVSVVVDSHLRVDGNVLGHDLVNQIFDELTIPNRAKKKAKKAKRWGWWDLPDDFLLGDLDGDTVVIPRGFALELKLLLREHDIRVKWIDRRTRGKGPKLHWRKKFTPRIHQPAVVKAIIKHQQGMYEAPTGSGKSLSCISFIHKVRPRKAIILTDQKGLLNQWIKDLNGWLEPGGQVGQIGGGKWIDDKRITVATVQSIWSKIKRGEIDQDWFDQFDCMILDECHHVSADTIQHIVGRFSAKYRFGVSATPDRQDDKFEFAQNVLGEVFHANTEEELREAGVLVRPKVYAIKTGFQFTYWPDHDAEYDKEDRLWHCQKPGCKLSHKEHGHRNNYQNLKDKIVADPVRNLLIVSTVLSQLDSPHTHLVISDEIRHLEAIHKRLTGNAARAVAKRKLPPVFMLTGQVKGNARIEMMEDIMAAPECIILSTVAKEGLDIPKIDRIYLPWPSSSIPNTQQKIGRGTRTSDGKEESLIFDFNDILVDLLRKQFIKRRWQCYDALGLEVVV